MTKRAKKSAEPDLRCSIVIQAREDEPAARTVARSICDPATLSASTVARLNWTTPELDVNALIAELQEHAREASAGNLGRSESMLVAQAHTLDALFHKLTGWALNNATGENANAAHFETCMRLALKAQSQCRATNETLAAIKNPPVVYARQANIANGPQQVLNNGTEPSRVREIESAPTKLLEAQHGQRLDTGAPATAIGTDKTLEAMGAINGAANGRG